MPPSLCLLPFIADCLNRASAFARRRRHDARDEPTIPTVGRADGRLAPGNLLTKIAQANIIKQKNSIEIANRDFWLRRPRSGAIGRK
jgi:hypothetical protein